MAGAGGHFTYVSDDGGSYCVRGDASNAALTGGTACTPAPGNVYPRGWEKRYVIGLNATAGRRRIPVYDPANALWLGTTNTFSAPNFTTLAAATYDVTARIGEKRTSRG